MTVLRIEGVKRDMKRVTETLHSVSVTFVKRFEGPETGVLSAFWGPEERVCEAIKGTLLAETVASLGWKTRPAEHACNAHGAFHRRYNGARP